MVVKGSWWASLARCVGDVLMESLLAAGILSAMNALANFKLGAGELAMMTTCWVAGLTLSQVIRRQFEASRWWLAALEWGGPVILLELINGRFLHAVTFAQITYAASLIMALVRGWRLWTGRCERAGLDRHAETLRVMLVALAAGWMMVPFFTDRLLGGTDARWYGGMFTDFVQQIRAGVFPVFVGQGEYAFNGSVNLFRSAPVCLWLAGVWDWITFRALAPLALNHLSMITAGLGGAIGMYAALILVAREAQSGAAISSWSRWLAALAAVIYVLCPAGLTLIYGNELQMSFTAAAILPWIFYGNVRTIIRPDGRGYVTLAVALALTWMAHAPLAMICTLLTAVIQLGRLIFAPPPAAQWWAALRGAGLFALLSAFYFSGMSELPSELGPLVLREGLLLLGIAFAVTGLVRGVIWREWQLLPLVLAGGGLAWWILRPWALWIMAFAVIFCLLAWAGESLCPGLVRRKAVLVTVLAMLLGAVIADYWAGKAGFIPSELFLSGLEKNAQAPLSLFLPLSPKLEAYTDTQPGLGVWMLLVAGLVGAAGLSQLSVILLGAAAIPLLLLLLPVPRVSYFLAGFTPNDIGTMANIPLSYRLIPPLAALGIMGGFLTACFVFRRRSVWTVLALVILTAGGAWMAWEARRFVQLGWRATASYGGTEAKLGADNYAMGRYNYVLTPIPEYFGNGRQDVRLESRFLNARGEVIVDPETIAHQSEIPGCDVVSLHSRQYETDPEWLQLSPAITVKPSESLLLRFEFPEKVDHAGWLIFTSEHNYREYDLEAEPACPLGFGTSLPAARVIMITNSGRQPESYQFSVKTRPGNTMPRDGGEWAKVVVSRYRTDWVQIRTDALIPFYRAWVSADEAGFLETPRVWIPGYRAWVDGEPAKVLESRQHLAMVPVAAGSHTIELKFFSSFRLWGGLVVSAAAWVGVALGFLGGRLSRWRAYWVACKDAGHRRLAGVRVGTGKVTTVNWRIWLILVLLISAGLRMTLALQGGQGYWPDEGRYGRATQVATDLVDGNWRVAVDRLFSSADHMLFTLVALPAAMLEAVMGRSPAMVASYLGMFSVVALWLIWRVALAAGAEGGEAFIATALAACCSSLLFYARHFFPYDASLCFMLGALWCSLRPWSPWRAFLVGMLCSIGFLVYNGYWLMGGAILTVYSLAGKNSREIIQRAMIACTGLVVPTAVIIGVGAWLGHDLIALFRASAETISQGDFGLGYRVIMAYLWSAEGPICMLFAGGVIFALWRVLRGEAERRIKWWLGLCLLIVTGLIFFSDGAHRFVVYGRLVRCVVPVLCLLAAHGLECCARRWTWSWRAWSTVAIAVIGMAVFNFAMPLRQDFPQEFKRVAVAEVRHLQIGAPAIYQLVDAEHLWDVNLDQTLPPYDVLMRRPHPLQYRPYQYEGFSATQRAQLARHDISMQLIRLQAEEKGELLRPHRGDALWGDYPGPLRMVVSFPTGQATVMEPLLTTGVTGRDDCLYVQYLEDGKIRLGYEHRKGKGVISAPVSIDFNRRHEIIISFGALMPAGNARIYKTQSHRAYLKDWLLIALDGRTLLSIPMESHFSLPENIFLGANFIGEGSIRDSFTGRIHRVDRAPLEEIAQRIPPLAATVPWRDASWEGSLGPVTMELDLPQEPTGVAWPLVATGRPGAGDLLFVQRDAAGNVVFGLDHWGGNLILSRPMAAGDGPLRLLVSLGSMMPPKSSAVYQSDPYWLLLRQLAYVELNGQRVFAPLQAFYPAEGSAALGINITHATMAVPFFPGNMTSISLADPQYVMAASLQVAVQAANPDTEWLGYPGPLRLRVKFPVDRMGQAEPLLVSGVTGAADFLYVHYVDERHVRLGFDHWGSGGPVTNLLEVAPGSEHELLVSTGFLMPPAGARLYREQPQLSRLQTAIYVEMDGQPVLEGVSPIYAIEPKQVIMGANFAGGSTAGPGFNGEVLKVERVRPEWILKRLPASVP